ncbi:MAG: sigma-70 family RNA polymerase sigma factor [Candidatus Latescibacterota bacterium]
MTDAELVARTLAADETGYAGLVQRHRGAVQGMAYHWTGDFDAAQDIAQEAFVQAYLHLGELRDPSRFGPWLRQLAANLSRRWLSTRRRHCSMGGEEAVLPSLDPLPSERVERDEVRRLVHAALARLTPASRLAVALHYLGGLSYPEIGALLDIQPNAVAARLHRARRHLKESLMETVESGLCGERLGDDLAREVLEQARQRARQTRSRWSRQEFALSVDTGLQAARQFADGAAQVEMLSMLGEAGATWLNDPAGAVRAYEEALQIARTAQDRKEEVRLLQALCAAHLRHGQWAELRGRAEEALSLARTADDTVGQGRARAALDLADHLPGRWAPDQPGGYAMAAFPVHVGSEEYRWGDLAAVRHYSWGCPSRCAALVHLYQPRRFLGPALEPGARWEDPVPHDRHNMSWGTDEDLPAPVARSEVVAVDRTVVTPAGTFQGCVLVRTVIEPAGGGRAPDHTLRSVCGTRQAWYAPGVGLVKLRFEDQNVTRRSVWLIACDAPAGNDVFPLELGRTWRYRWAEDWWNGNLFEDVVRVVARDDGAACLSSATWGTQQPREAVLSFLEQQRACEEAAGDLEGQALVLKEVEARCPEGADPGAAEARRQRLLAVYEGLLTQSRSAADVTGQVRALEGLVSHHRTPERTQAVGQEILRLLEQAGDEQGLLEVQHNLQRRTRPLAPAEEQEWLERRLSLARDGADPLGQSRRSLEVQLLDELVRHHKGHGEHEQAAARLDELAALAREAEDADEAAHYAARAQLHRALAGEPEGPQCAYAAGTGTMREQDGRVTHLDSGRWPHSAHYPSGATGAADLLSLGPFFGSPLLGGPVGASDTDWLNFGIAGPAGGNLCESLRVTSTLAALGQDVDVPAGRFTGCARIETVLAASEEPRPMDPEGLARARGQLAGTRQAWYAPGMGLVKLCCAHRSGQVTQVELVEVHRGVPDGGWLGLGLGNRWRYRWTDTATGTVFEDDLQVAARRGGRWTLSFVTRARLPGESAAETVWR